MIKRPHDGWLDVAKPFIAAFHAGKASVDEFIEEDELIYWYRPTLRNINCDATDTCMVNAPNASGNYFIGRPDGWQSMADSVFVVSLLKSAGTVTVTSGSSSPTSFNAPAGAAAFSAPMAVGQQSFTLARGGQNVLSGTSLRDISADCPCGLYNFNAFVGTLPPGPPSALDSDGLAKFTSGLRVTTCQPSPSLAAAAPSATTAEQADPTQA
jgi:Glycosyl hydrolase family 71